MAYHDPIPCPVCGKEILEPHDICDVCGWENDTLQLHKPDRLGGANPISLNQARDNYVKSGRSKPGETKAG